MENSTPNISLYIHTYIYNYARLFVKTKFINAYYRFPWTKLPIRGA